MIEQAEAPRRRPVAPKRSQALDAYRGMVMVALAAAGFGIVKAAREFPESAAWQAAAFQFEHVEWMGCSFWDLIQPSFMFLVGVSMAYSYSKRAERGDTYGAMLWHAVLRAVALVALGVFLSSIGHSQTNFEFVNVLAQIGLGYVFVFLLWNRRWTTQLACAGGILVIYWVWFAFTPLPPDDFDLEAVGVSEEVRIDDQYTYLRHWQKNANPAAAFDRWILNLFPREEPFVYNRGGYTTLNFVPSIATMIFGLMAGAWLRSDRFGLWKLLGLLAAGGAALALGLALHEFEICPAIKRIWTPSWAIYSSGWCLLILAGFYLALDGLESQFWAAPLRWLMFPLIVVGVNSILMYMMSQLLIGWTGDTLQRHLGDAFFHLNEDSPLLAADFLQLGPDYREILMAAYPPIALSLSVLLVFWLILFWLYRQKAFIRL